MSLPPSNGAVQPARASVGPMARGDTITVKKYSNRRLYDTSDSRYITLDELAQKIRAGAEVKVIDAKTGNDLTQATLALIILESRRAARLLPVPLLVQLIRMGDDALSEFFSSYMSWALDIYLHAKSGAQAIAPFNPFAALPFSGANPFAKMFAKPGGADNRGDAVSMFDLMMRRARSFKARDADEAGDEGTDNGAESNGEAMSEPSNGELEFGLDDASSDLAELRREVEALKEALRTREGK